MRIRTWISLTCLGVALSIPNLAFALTEWNFSSSSNNGCVSGCGTGSSAGAQETTRVHSPVIGLGPNVSITSWSNANGGSLVRETSGRWSGLGVMSAGETAGEVPNHALDNAGNTEFLLFDFGTTLWALTEVGIGWYQNDSDISVLAYDGNDNPIPGLTGETLTQNLDPDPSDLSPNTTTLTNNWTVVGNYSNLHDHGFSQDLGNTGPGQKFSSFWIVAAYNSAFGGKHPSSGSGGLNSVWKDYFKVKTIAGEFGGNTTAPAPATLVLFVLGLAAFAAGSRRATR